MAPFDPHEALPLPGRASRTRQPPSAGGAATPEPWRHGLSARPGHAALPRRVAGYGHLVPGGGTRRDRATTSSVAIGLSGHAHRASPMAQKTFLSPPTMITVDAAWAAQQEHVDMLMSALGECTVPRRTDSIFPKMLWISWAVCPLRISSPKLMQISRS